MTLHAGAQTVREHVASDPHPRSTENALKPLGIVPCLSAGNFGLHDCATDMAPLNRFVSSWTVEGWDCQVPEKPSPWMPDEYELPKILLVTTSDRAGLIHS